LLLFVCVSCEKQVTHLYHGENAVPVLQEEVFRRGSQGTGQVLPHQLLQVPCLPVISGPRWLLLQGRRVLLHPGLPGSLRDQMCSLRPLCRRRSGHSARQDVPQHLLHVCSLQATVSVWRARDLYGQGSFVPEMYPNSRHGRLSAACQTGPIHDLNVGAELPSSDRPF